MNGREPVARAPERRSGTIRWELVLPSGLIAIGLLVLVRPRAREGGLIGLGVVVLVFDLRVGFGRIEVRR